METNTNSSGAIRPGFVKRCRAVLFTWRTARRLLVGVAVLVTLIAVFHAEEDWRGKRAWERFRNEWEAKGERFDMAAFMPKPVRDEQNFVKTPFFVRLMEKKEQQPEGQRGTARDGFRVVRPELAIDLYGGAKDWPSFGYLETGKLTDLGKWQNFYRGNTNFTSKSVPQDPAHDVLSALRKFDSIRKELLEANQRPFAVLPPLSHDDFEPLMSFFSAAKGLLQYLRLHAAACLEAGQSDQALADIKLSFRLAEALRSNHVQISHLVRIAVLAISANAIWEGLARHQWNQEQLVELQRIVSSVDLLADFNLTMRSGRAYADEAYDSMRRQHSLPPLSGVSGDTDPAIRALGRMSGLIPSWFFYQNQIRENQLFQECLLTPAELKQHRVPRERYEAIGQSPWLKRRTPFNIFAGLLAPLLTKHAAKTARGQTILDEAAVACALERFRLSNSNYPDRLEELVPRFIERLPTDVMGGELLKYRRSTEGGYVLYSVGWDEKDDGGVHRPSKGALLADEEGDWVWQLPAK